MNKLRFWCGFMWGLSVGLAILTYSNLRCSSLNPDRGTVNCIGTTVAYDLSSRGVDVTAISFDPETIGTPIIKSIYPDAEELRISGGYAQLRDALIMQGGDRGFYRYARSDGTRHMVSYVNCHGRIYIVDAQRSMRKIPLWLFYALDKGVECSFARLDNIDYADCEVLWKIVRRRKK